MVVANEAGSYAATQHLLRMGHRHLAVITGPMHLTNAVERLKGFRRALTKHASPLNRSTFRRRVSTARADIRPPYGCCGCCPALLLFSRATT